MCYGKKWTALKLIRCPGLLAAMFFGIGHVQEVTLALAAWVRAETGRRYLTDMEKSPGELWLARMMKQPTSLPISKLSAWCRERPS